MRLAFTTFAILKEPYGHPTVQEFDDRTPAVFEAAENSPGFISRAREVSQSDLSSFERDWGVWGRFSVPRFYSYGRSSGSDQRASTLSIWKDVPSVFEFVYNNLHAEALKQRTSWFIEPKWPSYAAWWIHDDHIPQWIEACRMLEFLHDYGPSPKVFDFRRCYEADGTPISTGLLRARGQCE